MIVATAIALMGGVLTLDYVTGRDIDLWLLYVIPIGIVSLLLGARFGYALTFLAAAFLFVTTMLFGIHYPSITAFASDRGIEALVFLVCAYLIGAIRRKIADSESSLDAPTRMD